MPEASVYRGQNRIAKRLILAIILCSSFITLITTGVQLYLEYRQDLELIHGGIESIRDSHLATLSHNVWAMDGELIQMELAGLIRQRDFEYIVVETAGGRSWSAGQSRSEKRISAELPLAYLIEGREKRIGSLTIVASLDTVHARQIDKALFILGGNFLKTLLVAFFAFSVFQYMVTRHLAKLAQHLKELSFSGTPSSPLQLERLSMGDDQIDELDLVVTAINSMQASLANFVDEQQQTEDRLCRSEEQLQAILNNALAVIVVRDLEGRYLYVNPSYEEVFDVTDEGLRGCTLHDVFPAEFAEAIRERDLEAIARNEAVVAEDVVQRADGLHTYLTVRFPLRDETGKPYAVCGMGTDITERKRTEEHLRESERRYRELADLLPQAIFELDVEGNITFGNRQGLVLFGYSPDDLARKINVAQIIAPQDRERMVESMRERLSGKRGRANEYQVLRRDGSTFPALAYSDPIERNGEIVGIRGLLIDITERKQAEDELKRHHGRLEELVSDRTAALRQSEERLALAMDAANDGLWDFNPQSGETYLSPRWYTMLGYQPDEMPPSYATFTDLIHPEDRAETQAYIELHIVSGEPFLCEFRMCQKDGDYLWVLNRGQTMAWDEQGHPLRLVGMHTDISERKQAEEAMAKAKALAEAASHAKSEFLANMSHEIRTPLNAVIGYSELLSSMVSDPDQQSYLDAIKIAGKSLLTLVNDILDLSKIEAGMLAIVPTPVNLQLVFGEMNQIFKGKLGRRNLRFNVSIDPQLPALLMLDETRIRQILLNLVGNAVKFTPEGEVSLRAKRLDARLDRKGIDLLIAVEDSGIGIPEDERGQIFESFEQLAGHDSKRFGGTGLGLAICKRLVEMMNGQISVSNRAGGGSLFEVVLRGVEIATLGTMESIEDALSAENILFDKARILVVDDIESNRDLLCELLGRVNLDVLAVENGREALNLVEDYRPELIIMDIRMPVMDGIEATRQLKVNPKTRQIPIIALTASTTEDQSSLAAKGFDGYLLKPAGGGRLFSELAHHLVHQVVKEPDVEEICGVSLAVEEITRPDELVSAFHAEILPVYEGIKGAMEMDRVQQLGEGLVELGRKHNARRMTDYGVELINYVKRVDVVNTRSKIAEFPDLAKQLSNLVRKNHA